jgi:hypothetical protein
MYKPNLLIISNEFQIGDSIGQINGYQLLSMNGEIGSINTVSHATSGSDNFLKVLKAMKETKYDILIIWSPGSFPRSEDEFSQLMEINRGRTIVYWEGDTWGIQNSHGLKGKKIPTVQMRWWLVVSDFLFTTASFPQADQFLRMGAKRVFHTLQTYCHVQFEYEEKVPPDESFEYDLSMMCRNLARIPLLTGLPGSAKRLWVVNKIRKIDNIDFRLFGSNWPKNWTNGLLAYSNLASEMRKSRFNVNWDHFDQYHDYSSDRLPIAMISGRPSFSTLHPGMNWLQGKNLGLFLYDNPKKLVESLKSYLTSDPKMTHHAGLQGHSWAKNRISHRESARYVMSIVCEVSPPPADPWSLLPSPLSLNEVKHH